ncbi:MAG: translocation/assembly module TamB domain-containing protein [Kofleriaceae bacterium]
MATAREVHGWRRGLRWIKRGALGLLVVLVVAIGGALAFIHTDYGRDQVRGFGNDQLAKLFVGGGTIGHIDGSPFGELILRDVVINGPDHQPAIRAKTVRVSVGIFDLVKHTIKLQDVIAEDVDLAIKREADGSFAMAKLLEPDPNPTKSTWNVDLDDIDLVRAHVMIDTGTQDTGVVNLDDVVVLGNLHLHNDGTVLGGLRIGATWRERKAPITILAAVRDDAESTRARHLDVSIGGVSMAASDIAIVKAPNGGFPHIAGTFVVDAPKQAVAALVPRIQLPGDVAFSLTAGAAQGAMIPIALAGHVGASSVKAELQADPDAKHVTGTLTTSELDLATLTQQRIDATGALAATFDLAQGAPGELPTATATITAHGTYQKLPRTALTGQLASHGQQVTADLAVTGPMQAKLTAAITRAGAALHLDRAHLVATIADPKVASGGKAPFHGQLAITVDASGALSPSPDLAVKATAGGKRLRMQDLSIATLAVSIDGTHLPYQPHGKATVTATDIIRGEMQLGRIDLDARDRSDGKIAVNVTSHPKQNPWMIELAALVTPPGRGDTVTIDLGKHRVRAGNGTEWIGDGGRIVIDPRQIALDTLASKSDDGAITVAGTLDRRDGDLSAKLEVDRFTLAALGPRYRGLVTAHVAITRSHDQFAGTADVTGTGLATDLEKPPVDLQTTIAIKPGTLTVDATVGSATLGHAALALDLTTPRDLTDVRAWKRAGRTAIQSAKLTATNVDLGQLATILAQPLDTTVRVPGQLKVLGHVYALTRPKHATPVTTTKPQLGGHLDGELTITATTAKGDFKIQKLHLPQIHGVGRIDAELAIDQPTAQRVVPTVTLKIDQVGTMTARAELALPANVFDVAAWQRVGLDAVHGATVRTTDIAFDPAMLQRFGIESSMRGKAKVSVDVSAGLDAVKVVGDITELRGSPIAQPVAVHLEANLDGKTATAKLAVTTKQATVTLLSVDAKLPITLDQLRANPRSISTAALDAKLELQQTSAPALLAVFGRDVITEGTLNGTVTVTGTLEQPRLIGHIVAANIKSTPGSFGRPTPVMKQLVLDATYGDRGGKLTLVGTEDQGGTLNVDATFDLNHLTAGTATVKAAKFDMRPMLAFAPDPGSAAKGILDANLAIHGFDPRTAQITGDLHLNNARLPIAPSVGTVRQANIDVTITPKQIKVAATGKLGKGTIALDGTIALNGADLAGGEAKLVLHKVSPIGAVEPEVDAEITAKISRQNERWTAEVTVDKGFVKINKTSGEALKPVGTPDDLHLSLTKLKPKRVAATGTGPNAPPPPVQPGLVAHVTLNPIKVEADEFRTTVHGKLDVTTDATTLGVVGTIEATSGDLDLFDRRYRVERAAVTFDGTVDPNLEIRITHDFPDVTTVTEVRGRLSKPDLALSSDPGGYSQSELLGFLLGGEPGGDPQSASARDKAAQVGSSIVANQIGGYVKKALPFDLDVIRYEAATATSSAAITVGSWITHTLFFSFSQHMNARADENSGEGTLEYWFTRRLELELTAGDRNYDGADLLWRKRY